jgi:hypothetical protein
MARSASLDQTTWLPTYGWWPRAEQFDVTVVLTPYHAAIEPDALFSFTLRGYVGSNEPVWEHEVGELRLGEDRGIRLVDLRLPDPPHDGGILEVHGVRHDKPPRKGVGFVGMWIDAQSPEGGGYVIPTIPIRAQAKAIQRDDLQVVPGLVATERDDTELVLLNVVDEPTEVRLTATSLDGLAGQGRPFTIEPWTAWRGSVSQRIPHLRRLLAPGGGTGSLSIQASHRLLPYFGFSRDGGPLLSLDHTAPIFA